VILVINSDPNLIGRFQELAGREKTAPSVPAQGAETTPAAQAAGQGGDTTAYSDELADEMNEQPAENQNDQQAEGQKVAEDLQQALVASGGDGDDTIKVHQNEDGTLSVDIGGKMTNYTKEQAQNLIIDGGKGNDRITADDSVTYKLKLSGGEGNDYIKGGKGDDMILGGDGNDMIVGGDGNDVVDGGKGNNYIKGGKGDDTIFGGDGNNMILGGDGNDYIKGGKGNNYIDGGKGDDTILGGDSNDTILGRDGNDVIDGGKGNDYIDGGKGNDSLAGGDGNDAVLGGDGRDYIEGGKGNDYLDGGKGDDVMYGLDGNDTMIGGDGNDYMDGGKGSDAVHGGKGDDMMFGGKGDDYLDGGDGDDIMAGGAGTDLYNGGAGADQLYAQKGDWAYMDPNDTITKVNLNTTNAQGTKLGSSIGINGNDDFKMRVESDLEAMRSIPIGRKMLNALDNSGKGLSINSTDQGNHINFTNWDDAFLNNDGSKGKGTGSQVYYNPYRVTLGQGNEGWQNRPPLVGLYHELAHALNAATGTMQTGNYNDTTRNLEQQAVGLPNTGVPFDNDNNSWTQNSRDNRSIFTENGLRAFLNLDQRPRY
jgi:Ca2+-binding RTX toxin-like protein